MTTAWRRVRQWLWQLRPHGRRDVPDALWQHTVRQHDFLAALDATALERLRLLSGEFLSQKEFHGAAGLRVTDRMAVAIAAQACLPLLRLQARPGARADGSGSPLVWYSDFVGIVVQPGEVVAHRERVDAAGVVHHFDEVIAGEAMDQGPVMLSWSAVEEAGASADQGYNVVIHEFAHKLDLADGLADGCPALQAGFMGQPSAAQARRAWFADWTPAYEAFCEQVVIAERFGGTPPWLDDYAAQSPDEFFAVACEAYFVRRAHFAQQFPTLMPSLDAFFGLRRDAGLR